MARIVEEGGAVRTLVLGEGETSRDPNRSRSSRFEDIEALRQQLAEANSRLGVTDVHALDFPDNRFDSVPLLDLIKAVEEHVTDFRPSAVLTHFGSDLNVDHSAVLRAVLTATRPLPAAQVPLVASFEVLSSTGWLYPHTFSPSLFVRLGEHHLQNKREAMDCYSGELRAFPHARSLDAITDLARMRGASIGTAFAEAFQLCREVLL